MTALNTDLDNALNEVLVSAHDQTDEFKRRLRRLIENATTANLGDDDVREVIELTSVEIGQEE